MSRAVGDATGVLEDQSIISWFIAEIAFGTRTSRVSQGETTPFNGGSYIEGTLRVDSMTWDEKGVQTCKISLLEDGSAGTLVLALTNTIADTPITIWQVYKNTATEAITTPVLVVKGSLNPLSITDDEIKLEVKTIDIDSETYPTQYCTQSNGFTHLPTKGQVINWGGEKYELVTD